MSTTTATRRPRRTRAIAAAAVLTAGIVLAGATAANAATSASIATPNGHNSVAASASQSGWTGTVSVSGTVFVRPGECVIVSEQGHNNVTGYGAWKQVTATCASRSFSFSVSDYYSDSVAIKITDGSGSRSAHVWN